VDGVSKPPHGDCFKKWARHCSKRIGDVEVTTRHDYFIRFKFAWACQSTDCNVVIKRHSRSVDTNRQCCGKCRGRLFEIEVPDSPPETSGTPSTPVAHTPKERRKPTAFSLFVSENSKKVRERLIRENGKDNVKQTHVFKECGRLWKEKKECGTQGITDVTNRLSDIHVKN